MYEQTSERILEKWRFLDAGTAAPQGSTEERNPNNLHGIECPSCRKVGDFRTVEARPSNGSVRRRRQCFNCRHRFTTYERIDGSLAKSVPSDLSEKLRRLEFLERQVEKLGAIVRGMEKEGYSEFTVDRSQVP